MKKILTISIGLNLGLSAALLIFPGHRPKGASVPANALPGCPARTNAPVGNPPGHIAAGQGLPPQFQWSQLLDATNDFGCFVASLRAIGCPEPTVEDIVSGDARRAFAFQRQQLGLDGSGSGAWSRYREARLVASLLGTHLPPACQQPATVTQTSQEPVNEPMTGGGNAPAGTTFPANAASVPAGQPQMTAPVYPLVFQKVNLDALGFNDSQKTAIAQVQQQFVTEIGGGNQNPDDPAYLPRWQQAQSNADAALRSRLGTQAYMACQQQLYYNWYQPQVQAANTAGTPLAINPGLFPGR